MSNNELKPCPFCGGEAKIGQVVPLASVVYCTKCRATIKEVPVSVHYCADDKATTIWNQRANEEPRWLPATELPPNDNEVLVWFEYFRYGSYNRLYRTHGIGSTFHNEWSGIVNGVSGWSSLKILAWMPLPEPPKMEADHGN